MVLHTVCVFNEFRKAAKGRLSDEHVNALIDHLMGAPESGDVIPGTGGCRKLRWQATGRGRRGGSRVITCFVGWERPVYVIMVYIKAEKTDLNAVELKTLKEISRVLKSSPTQEE